MMDRMFASIAGVWIALSMAVTFSAGAQTAPVKMGVVVMHGKGGSPNGYVKSLAEALQAKGYLVANLEMPWSGKRNYDKNVASAEDEVTTALNALPGEGAAKLFVAGHSQGGVFALEYGSKYSVDGLSPMVSGDGMDVAV